MNKEEALLKIVFAMMSIGAATQEIADLVVTLDDCNPQLEAEIMAYVYIVYPALEMANKIIAPHLAKAFETEDEIASVLEWMEQNNGQRSDGDA